MKKTLYLFGFLVALVVVVFLVVKSKKKDSVSYDKSNLTFNIGDPSIIDRIYLVDKKDNEIELQKTANGWTVNEKFKARPDAIASLLETMNLIRAEQPVARAAHDNIVKAMSISSTKVEVFDDNNDLITAYYVGGPTPAQNGTYMYMAGDESPYIITIPGWDGFVTKRYFTDELDWRDRTVFNIYPDEVSQITVNYSFSAEKSFSVKADAADTSFVLVDNANNLVEGASNRRMKEYVSYFTSLSNEVFINNSPNKDSILAQTPFVEVTVLKKSGDQRVLKAYYRGANKRTKLQFDKYGNKVKIDPDKFYAKVDGEDDFMLIQNYVFGKVFRSIDDFTIR